MKFLSLLLIILFLVTPSFSKVTGVLPELLKPRTISVDDTQLYVTEAYDLFGIHLTPHVDLDRARRNVASERSRDPEWNEG